MLVVTCDIICILVSLYLFFTNIKKVTISTRYVCYYLFFFVFVVPLICDYLIGLPDYSVTYLINQYHGFKVSYNDPETRMVYDIFLLINEFIILKYNPRYRFVIGKRYLNQCNVEVNTDSQINEVVLSRGVSLFLLLISSLTPALVFMSTRNSLFLLVFGWREQGLGTSFITGGFYTIFEKMSYIGMTTSLLLVLLKRKEKGFNKCVYIVLGIILTYMNLCIESKRSIIFFCIIMIFIIEILLNKSQNHLFAIIFVAALAIVFMVFLTLQVKMDRGYGSISSVYTAIRIDMFRDDTVKMVINNMLGKDVAPILEYPFQSYLTQINCIFPLDILANRGHLTQPVGFNIYLTTALINADLAAKNGFMTTSMFDELIANFSIVGLFIGSIILVRLTKKIDQMQLFEEAMWLGGIVLLMFYSIDYIIYYLELAFFISLHFRRKRSVYGKR